jgi:hypothetical protein
LIEAIRAVRFVADQLRREFVEATARKSFFHNLAFGSRQARKAHGQAP